MIGKTIGQYQIIDKIGEGGMGAVYKAEDTTLHRLVAIKTLSAHLTEDEEAQKRFIREAQAASALNHPNITTVYEFIEDDDTRLICMEYVEGKTIRDMVETGTVSIRKAIDIITQAAEALEAAHNKGILHRDVKSANIMVNMEGRVKVMDFGLAQLAGKSQLTRTGTTMGTLSYSSPEQISGKPVDRRSEIFSLGVVFYELLTGQLPFKATNEAEILFAIINNEPPKLSKLRDDVPELVEAVVSRMLEKDTELRYQTCGDVISDLKGIRKEMETSTVGITGVLGRIQASRKKVLAQRLAISIVAIAVVVSGIVLLSTGGNKLDPNLVLVAIFDNQTGNPDLDNHCRLMASMIERGIQASGIVNSVPYETVNRLTEIFKERTSVGDDTDYIDYLTTETGAGTVVIGSMFLVDPETLQLQSTAINPLNGEQIISPPEPVVGLLEDFSITSQELSDRIWASLSLLFDARLSQFAQDMTAPPSLEAFRLYSEGVKLFFRSPSAALPFLLQAAALDSTYAAPHVSAAVIYWNSDNYQKADSLLRIADRSRESLTHLDRLFLDNMRAATDGDIERDYETALELAEKDPSQGCLAGLAANWTNRPGKAVDILLKVDPESPFMEGWEEYWNVLCTAYHMLGEHRKELKAARQGKKQYPNYIELVRREAYALAALGQIRKVDELMERAFPLPDAAANRRNLARELKVHGHPEESAEIISNLIDWYESRPDREKTTEDYRIDYAITLGLSERWRESGSILEELCTEFPDNLSYLLRLGIYSARSGDNERARNIISQLAEVDRPYTLGRPTVNQAFIYGWLGEKEEAVRLLRVAYSQGYKYSTEWHRNELFEPLWDYPAFQDLLRPKG